MKAYGRVVELSHIFLILEIDGSEFSPSRRTAVLPEKAPSVNVE